MAGPVSSHEITLNNLEYDKMGESDPKNLKLRAKELGLCHKLKLYNPYIFATLWSRSLIFQI